MKHKMKRLMRNDGRVREENMKKNKEREINREITTKE